MHRIPVREYRLVLVPLDGSRFSERALPYAEAVARRTGARLELVYVHELPIDVGGLALDAQTDEELREREREYLRSASAAVAERSGIRADWRLLVGRAAASIEERARESGAGLIVMCTHGRGGVERAWLGSVADALVRRDGIPLLLVRPTERRVAAEVPALDEVLIALDGSALSEGILPHAATLARPDRTRWTLLRVVPPELVVGGHVFRLDEERKREVAAHAEAYLGRVADAAGEHVAEVRTRVVEHETPAAAILEAAESAGADLIAMTTHGHGGVKRLLLGSVADKVLRAAETPLLVSRPPG